MKRFVSCLAVLALLAGFIVPAPVTVKAEDTMSVRILNDFEATTLTQTNSRNVSTGAQANSIEAGGYEGSTALKMYNDNDGWLEYDVYSYNASGIAATWRDEWQEAKYLQFYVDNRGPGKVYVAFTSMKKDSGAIDGYQDYRFTEATQFIASEDGKTWTNLDKQINGNGIYEVIIPANFQGFVRAELNTTNLAFPEAGWGDYEGQIGKLEMTFGVKNSTVFIDDVAIVGTFTSSVDGYQKTETDYFKGAIKIPGEVVRILNDFDAATLTETNSRIASTGAQANSFEAGGYQNSTALKMYNDNDGWLEYDVYSYNASGVTATWRDEWQQAKYIQFYVDNQGPGNVYVAFSSMKKDSGALDYYQDFRFTDATQYLGSADGVTWTNLDKQINGNGIYEVIIPANFKGFVRAELNTTNLAFPEAGWGDYEGQVGKLEMTFGVKNSTVFIDDIALVSESFNDTIEGYQFTLADYLSDRSGNNSGGGNQGGGNGEPPAGSEKVDLEDVDDIRVLQNFTESSRTEAHAGDVNTGAQANSFAEGGVDGSVALKMYNDNDGWLRYRIYSYTAEQIASAWRDNWQQAKYLQFFVKNEGPGVVNICLSSMKVDSGAMDGYQEFDITAAAQFVYSTDGVNWYKLDKSMNGNGQYEVSIPSGFTGYIRVELNADNLSFPDPAWGSYEGQIGMLDMTFGVKNSTVYIDDIALAGNFTDTIAGAQTTEAAYFGLRTLIEMPEDVENIRTVLDFEKGIADINSGINFIPATFSQSTDWAATGTNSLKLVVNGTGGSDPRLTQVQPSSFYGDATTAQYLEFSIKNASDTPFGITWCKLNGTSFNANNAQIAIFEDGVWYAVEAYDEESFLIPANYEGKIRIKFGVNGVILMDTLISSFEFAVKETTCTAGAALYMDTFCLIGEPLPEVVYEEVTMPSDLDLVKTVIDFEKINLVSLKSGINFLPVTFSLGTEIADSGNALIVTTGVGGGTPNLSQLQPAKFFQNWTGGQYLEMWISNPNDFDFAYCWSKIDGVDYDNKDTEISLQFPDGKWYKAQTGGDADGAIIPAGFTGKLRVKLDEKFGDLVMVENLEFALWCAADIADQKIYIDSIVVLGDMEQHDEPEVPNSVKEFPVEDILEKIAEGQKVFEYQIPENKPVPAEIIEAIKGKDIVFSYTVLNKYGIGLYRWTLIGSELTDITEFYPVVTLEDATEIEGARVKGFKVENGEVKGAYLSLYVRNDFPSFTVMHIYDATEKVLLSVGDIVNELGWFTLVLEDDGEYLLSDDMITTYNNDSYPTEEETTEPSESETTKPSESETTEPSGSEGDASPDTGDTHTGLIICMMATSLVATGVLVRKRKER